MYHAFHLALAQAHADDLQRIAATSGARSRAADKGRPVLNIVEHRWARLVPMERECPDQVVLRARKTRASVVLEHVSGRCTARWISSSTNPGASCARKSPGSLASTAIDACTPATGERKPHDIS